MFPRKNGVQCQLCSFQASQCDTNDDSRPEDRTTQTECCECANTIPFLVRTGIISPSLSSGYSLVRRIARRHRERIMNDTVAYALKLRDVGTCYETFVGWMWYRCRCRRPPIQLYRDIL